MDATILKKLKMHVRIKDFKIKKKIKLKKIKKKKSVMQVGEGGT